MVEKERAVCCPCFSERRGAVSRLGLESRREGTQRLLCCGHIKLEFEEPLKCVYYRRPFSGGYVKIMLNYVKETPMCTRTALLISVDRSLIYFIQEQSSLQSVFLLGPGPFSAGKGSGLTARVEHPAGHKVLPEEPLLSMFVCALVSIPCEQEGWRTNGRFGTAQNIFIKKTFSITKPFSPIFGKSILITFLFVKQPQGIKCFDCAKSLFEFL